MSELEAWVAKGPNLDKGIEVVCDATLPAYLRVYGWAKDGRIDLGKVSPIMLEMFPSVIDQHLARLLGYADAETMVMNWDGSHLAVIAGLAGEHGWSIYKMLLARIK